MIESMSVKAVISACPKPGNHLPDPSRVAFFRDLAERSKRCSAQVMSHITGAPIGIAIRAARGQPTQVEPLMVSFSLPLAFASIGQGLLHGWTECLDPEKRVAARLLRKILEEQGFTSQEARSFTVDAKASSANLVWHIEMNDRVAALDLMERAARQVKVLHVHNDDDFYGIQDYVFTDTSTEVSLQIVLSSGNGLKLSIQPEHLSKYTELHVFGNVRTEDILAMTKTHIRVDITIGCQLLDKLDNANPSGWSRFSLESCIDTIWTQAGFMTKYVPDPAMLSTKGYPPEARIIHRWYLQYQGLDENYQTVLCDLLLKSGFDHHLRASGLIHFDGFDEEPNLFALHLKDGVDLRVRPSEHKFLDGAIGERLHYSRRWHVPDEMQDLIVSTTTEPRLSQALSERHQGPRQEILERDTSPFDFADWCHESNEASSFKNRSIRKSKRPSK